SWGTALVPPADTTVVGYADQTLRMVVRMSSGGTDVRIRLANTFGTAPVTFASVYVGLRATGAAVRPGSHRRVTFDGERSVTVPVGQRLFSDAISVAVPSGGDLVVSMYLPARGSGPASWHPRARASTYLSARGNHAGAESAGTYRKASYSWFFLDGVEVRTRAMGTVVAFGDSITDGSRSTIDANQRYPDILAARLREAGIDRGVVNTGIAGNRLLSDGVNYGPNARARFDRDVLDQSGVTDVIVLIGINDIGYGVRVTAADLVAGFRDLIQRARAEGVRIHGGTLLPYAGAGYYTVPGERVRRAVNEWIRHSGEFDGVVDFDRAMRDPEHPSRLRPGYDSGDHLHPSDEGYRAMAYAVDLGLFTAGKSPEATGGPATPKATGPPPTPKATGVPGAPKATRGPGVPRAGPGVR
ncbi:MAG: SGNH/GDSL hydrolase family protein, partial [Micromonosporaceae bacterium]